MFEGLFQPTHLIVVLVIALLVVGPKKLPEMGRSLGSSMRGFKDAIAGNDDEPAAIQAPPAAPVAVAHTDQVAVAAPAVAVAPAEAPAPAPAPVVVPPSAS